MATISVWSAVKSADTAMALTLASPPKASSGRNAPASMDRQRPPPSVPTNKVGSLEVGAKAIAWTGSPAG